MKTRFLGLVLMTTGCALAACGGPRISSAAPPLEVCGQVISDTPAGAVLTDASVETHVAGVPTAGSAVFIKLTPNCLHGATITFDPPTGAVVFSSAKAQDGKLAAVGVCLTGEGHAHIVRADRSTSAVDLPRTRAKC
ncbi:hypothetical protein [Terrabacter sp. NPDC080008]|uniref:hypothetical protein n=1 Tax=Terrabacter sp. NPDC080008 TaxID=3155176 RepID=UPI0034500136